MIFFTSLEFLLYSPDCTSYGGLPGALLCRGVGGRGARGRVWVVANTGTYRGAGQILVGLRRAYVQYVEKVKIYSNVRTTPLKHGSS